MGDKDERFYCRAIEVYCDSVRTAMQVARVQLSKIASLQLARHLTLDGRCVVLQSLQPLHEAKHRAVAVYGILIEAQQLKTGQCSERVSWHAAQFVVIQVTKCVAYMI